MAEGKRQKAEGVPEGWIKSTAGEQIVFSGGAQPPRSTFLTEPTEETIRLIQIRDYKTDKFATYIPKKLARKFCSADDIMIGRYGPPIFQILRGIEGAYNVALIKATPNKGLEREYLWYFLKQDALLNFIESLSQRTSGQTGIEMDELKDYPFPLPPLPEQRKIAAILSTWDDSLATLTNLLAAKRQQKRGLAEALLTGKKRLPGFEGEWEEKKLGDVFTRITRKNTEGNERALTISGTLGLIDQREFFNKRVAAADLSGYCLIRRGEFAYNKSYSAGYDFGAIKRLNRYESGVVSTLYICFALSQADAVSDFYEQFFEAGLLNEGISGIAQEGARNHGLLNVSAKDFFELPITVPDPKEQQAIASILSTLDGEIASLEALKAKVQEQKRGLMDELLTGRVRVAVEGGAYGH